MAMIAESASAEPSLCVRHCSGGLTCIYSFHPHLHPISEMKKLRLKEVKYKYMAA